MTTTTIQTGDEIRGFRITSTDPTTRSSLLRFTRDELQEMLDKARADRRQAEADHGRWSFEHGQARGRICLLVEALQDRSGIIPRDLAGNRVRPLGI